MKDLVCVKGKKQCGTQRGTFTARELFFVFVFIYTRVCVCVCVCVFVYIVVSNHTIHC